MFNKKIILLLAAIAAILVSGVLLLTLRPKNQASIALNNINDKNNTNNVTKNTNSTSSINSNINNNQNNNSNNVVNPVPTPSTSTSTSTSASAGVLFEGGRGGTIVKPDGSRVQWDYFESILSIFIDSQSASSDLRDLINKERLGMKLSYMFKDIVDAENPNNTFFKEQYYQAIKYCKLDLNQVKLPFMFDNYSGKCYLGAQDIITELRRQAGY